MSTEDYGLRYTIAIDKGDFDRNVALVRSEIQALKNEAATKAVKVASPEVQAAKEATVALKEESKKQADNRIEELRRTGINARLLAQEQARAEQLAIQQSSAARKAAADEEREQIRRTGINARLQAKELADAQKLQQQQAAQDAKNAAKEQQLLDKQAEEEKRESFRRAGINARLQAQEFANAQRAQQQQVADIISGRAGIIPAIQAFRAGTVSASDGIKGIVTNLEQVRSSLVASTSLVNVFKSIVTDIVKSFVIFAAVKEATQAFRDMVSEGIGFNNQLETAKIGIAAIISASSEVFTAGGKIASPAQQLGAASVEAQRQLGLLRVDALETVATFQELVDTFQAATGPGLAAGLTTDQIRNLSLSVSQAAAAIALPKEQIPIEIREILSGTIVASRTRIAQVLGITNEDIRNAKEMGNLAGFLNERFQAFNLSADATQKSFFGMKSNLEDAIALVLGAGSEGLFNNIKTGMQSVKDLLVEANAEGVFQPKPATLTFFKEIFSVLELIVGKAEDFIKALDAESIASFAKQVGAFLRGTVEFASAFVGSFGSTLSNILISIGKFLGLDSPFTPEGAKKWGDAIGKALGNWVGIKVVADGLRLATGGLLGILIDTLGAAGKLLTFMEAIKGTALAIKAANVFGGILSAGSSVLGTAGGLIGLNGIAGVGVAANSVLSTVTAIGTRLAAMIPLVGAIVGAVYALRQAWGNAEDEIEKATGRQATFFEKIIGSVFQVSDAIALVISIIPQALGLLAIGVVQTFTAAVKAILSVAAEAAEFIGATDTAALFDEAAASAESSGDRVVKGIGKAEVALISFMTGASKAWADSRDKAKAGGDAVDDAGQKYRTFADDLAATGIVASETGDSFDKLAERTKKSKDALQDAIDQANVANIAPGSESPYGTSDVTGTAAKIAEASQKARLEYLKESRAIMDSMRQIEELQASNDRARLDNAEKLKAVQINDLQGQQLKEKLLAIQVERERDALALIEAKNRKVKDEAAAKKSPSEEADLRVANDAEEIQALEKKKALHDQEEESLTRRVFWQEQLVAAEKILIAAKASGNQEEVTRAQKQYDAYKANLDLNERNVKILAESLQLDAQALAIEDKRARMEEYRNRLAEKFAAIEASRFISTARNDLLKAQREDQEATFANRQQDITERAKGTDEDGRIGAAPRGAEIRQAQLLLEVDRARFEVLQQINLMDRNEAQVDTQLSTYLKAQDRLAADKARLEIKKEEGTLTAEEGEQLKDIALQQQKILEAQGLLLQLQDAEASKDEKILELKSKKAGELEREKELREDINNLQGRSILIAAQRDFTRNIKTSGEQFVDSMKKGMEETSDTLGRGMVEIFKGNKFDFRTAFAQTLSSIATDIMSNLFRAITDEIVKGIISLTQGAAKNGLVSTLISAFGGAAAGAAGGAAGDGVGASAGDTAGQSQWQSFATGGHVGGHANAKGYAGGGRPAGLDPNDTVPIWADPREWVIRASSVGKYGHAVMSRINQGLVDPGALAAVAAGSPSSVSSSVSAGAGRAMGGVVGRQGKGQQQPVVAIMAPSNENFRRQLSGARDALLDFMQTNRSQINQRLS